MALLVLAALAVGAVALAAVLGRGADATAGSPTPGAGTSAAEDAAAATSTPPTSAPSTTAAPSAIAAPPTATASPSSGATSPGPAASSSDGCDPAKVVVLAETDKKAYGPADVPVLSLVVRNEGITACTVNVGTSQMEFVLTRAADRVFSSIDCQQASQDLDRIIEPGGEERATFEWSRNRTVPGCTVVEDKPDAGSYALTTRLGARSSSPVEFALH